MINAFIYGHTQEGGKDHRKEKGDDEIELKTDYKRIGKIRPRSIDYPMGEMEEFNSSVDDRESQRHKPINAPCY